MKHERKRPASNTIVLKEVALALLMLLQFVSGFARLQDQSNDIRFNQRFRTRLECANNVSIQLPTFSKTSYKRIAPISFIGRQNKYIHSQSSVIKSSLLANSLKLRCGASSSSSSSSSLTAMHNNPAPKQLSPSSKKLLVSSLTTIALFLVGYWKKALLLDLISSSKSMGSKLNEMLLSYLDKLNDAGFKGLVIYTISFMIWEMTAGITTPVETAAGIAFGRNTGITVNAIGKTLGATLSFILGRFVFFDVVHKNLKDNEMLQLVEESIKEHPLRVALLFRLSPLPEFVKNLGLSVLPVHPIYFIGAILLHGFPFTCLWTCLGAETSYVMRGGNPSTTLKILLSGVTWFGFLVSPTLIGLWVKSLRDKKKEHEKKN